MSFLKKLGSFAGEIAGSAYNDLQEKCERIQKYKNRYSCLSDEELFAKMKRAQGEEKMACVKLLEERGYGNHNNE